MRLLPGNDDWRPSGFVYDCAITYFEAGCIMFHTLCDTNLENVVPFPLNINLTTIHVLYAYVKCPWTTLGKKGREERIFSCLII